MEQGKTPEESKHKIFEEFKYLGGNLRTIADDIENFEDEIRQAKESLEDCKAYADKLLAEKAELAKALDEVQKRRDELLIAANNDELKLRRERADALLAVKRLQNALDAALNDVAFYRRAALRLSLAAVVAVLLAML